MVNNLRVAVLVVRSAIIPENACGDQAVYGYALVAFLCHCMVLCAGKKGFFGGVKNKMHYL